MGFFWQVRSTGLHLESRFQSIQSISTISPKKTMQHVKADAETAGTNGLASWQQHGIACNGKNLSRGDFGGKVRGSLLAKAFAPFYVGQDVFQLAFEKGRLCGGRRVLVFRNVIHFIW